MSDAFDDTRSGAPEGLPAGPPLHLERAGQVLTHLGDFLLPERLTRLQEVLRQRTQFITALIEHVHDPHNIAACVRSCEAMGIQDIYVVPQPGVEFQLSHVVSSGAQRWITVHRFDDTQTALAKLRKRGYRIAVTDLIGSPPSTALPEVRLETPLCVAFGNEKDGISDSLREAADLRIRIPMTGFVQSLNISVAVALIFFHLRQHIQSEHLLTSEQQAHILDRWIADDVPRSRSILEEIARRLDPNPADLRET